MRTTKFLIIAIFIALVLTGCGKNIDEKPFISPESSTEWTTATKQLIKWRADDANLNGNNPLNIYLYKNGETDFSEIIAENITNDGEYEWFVAPFFASNTNCFIKIAESDSVNGIQSENFMITIDSYPFSFTTPTGTDVFENGKEVLLKWNTTNEFENEQVQIDLYRKDNNKYIFETTIINITDNDGEGNWIVPNSVRTADYVLKITTLSQSAFGISSIFSIKKLDFTAPTGETVWDENTIQEIKWASQDWGEVDIELWDIDDNFSFTIATDVNDIGEYTWNINVPEIFEGTSANYYISVVSYMYEEDIYLNSEYFKINGKGEAREVYSPTGNDAFDEDGGDLPYIIPIKWAASGWSNVKITLHYEDSWEGGWQTYSIADNTQNDGEYNWTINENLDFESPSSAYIVISEINSNEEIQSEQFLIYE